MYTPKSHAIYIGDYQYGDVNYALNDYYNKVNIDFLKRLNNYNGSNKETFVNLLKNPRYSFFVYYSNNFTNSENVNGFLYNTNNLRILVYRNSIYTSDVGVDTCIIPTVYDSYVGIDPVDIREMKSYDYFLYYFNASGVLNLYDFASGGSTRSVYIPSCMINYMCDYTYNYLYNNYSLQEIEILMEMDEKLGSVDDTLQQQQEYLEQEPDSNDFSTSDLPTDSGVINPTTTEVDNIFSTIYNVFTGNLEYSKRNITVTIPFTRKEF